MNKRQSVLFIVTCWLTSFMAMWQCGELVVASDLYGIFAKDASVITAMLSWPTLLTAVSSLVAGNLLKKISTKKELIISGICGLFMILAPIPQNVLFMFICSMIAAIGAGFANTAGMTILSEIILDENVCSKHMGYYNAAMAIIGAVCSYTAGVLAVKHWTNAFMVNWIAIPMLIMSILFLPENPPEKPAENQNSAGEEKHKQGLGIKFWMFFFTTFLFMVSYVPISTLVSVYVSENQLGTTAFAGICSSLGTLGSFCSSILFGVVYKKLERKIMLCVSLLDIILYLLAIFCTNAPVAVVVCTFAGASYGVVLGLIYAYGSKIVPPQQNGMVMGIMTFNYAMAVTVGVYLYQFLMNCTSSMIKTLWLSVGICAVVFIAEAVISVRTKENIDKA